MEPKLCLCSTFLGFPQKTQPEVEIRVRIIREFEAARSQDPLAVNSLTERLAAAQKKAVAAERATEKVVAEKLAAEEATRQLLARLAATETAAGATELEEAASEKALKMAEKEIVQLKARLRELERPAGEGCAMSWLAAPAASLSLTSAEVGKEEAAAKAQVAREDTEQNCAFYVVDAEKLRQKD